jgi:hypothetical protein
MLVALLLVAPATHAQGVKDAKSAGDATETDAAGVGTLGLIDPYAYASPQFGTAVAWEEPWEADPGSMESSRRSALDRLSLVSKAGRFQAFFVGANGESAGSYLDRFMDYRVNDDPTIEIVDSGVSRDVHWIAYTSTVNGDLVHDLVEISVHDGGTVIQVVEVLAWSEDFDDALELATDAIEVDGAAPFVFVNGWPVQAGAMQDRWQ